MKASLYKSAGVFSAALIMSLFGTILLGNGIALAEDESNGNSSDSYVYDVKSGQNLTELVRSSIDLHTQSQDIELNNSERVAAETWAVQSLGSSEIQAGETVTIPSDVVEKYVSQAKDLGEPSQNAWSAYTGGVSFTAVAAPTAAPASISEEQISAAREAEENSNDSSNDGSDEGDESGEQEQNNEDSNDEDSNDQDTADTADSDDGSSSSTTFWIIAGVAAVVGWYYLWSREGSSSKKNK